MTTEDILNERRNTHGDFIQGSITFNALWSLLTIIARTLMECSITL